MSSKPMNSDKIHILNRNLYTMDCQISFQGMCVKSSFEINFEVIRLCVENCVASCTNCLE